MAMRVCRRVGGDGDGGSGGVDGANDGLLHSLSSALGGIAKFCGLNGDGRGERDGKSRRKRRRVADEDSDVHDTDEERDADAAAEVIDLVSDSSTSSDGGSDDDDADRAAASSGGGRIRDTDGAWDRGSAESESAARHSDASTPRRGGDSKPGRWGAGPVAALRAQSDAARYASRRAKAEAEAEASAALAAWAGNTMPPLSDEDYRAAVMPSVDVDGASRKRRRVADEASDDDDDDDDSAEGPAPRSSGVDGDGDGTAGAEEVDEEAERERAMLDASLAEDIALANERARLAGSQAAERAHGLLTPSMAERAALSAPVGSEGPDSLVTPQPHNQLIIKRSMASLNLLRERAASYARDGATHASSTATSPASAGRSTLHDEVDRARALLSQMTKTVQPKGGTPHLASSPAGPQPPAVVTAWGDGEADARELSPQVGRKAGTGAGAGTGHSAGNNAVGVAVAGANSSLAASAVQGGRSGHARSADGAERGRDGAGGGAVLAAARRAEAGSTADDSDETRANDQTASRASQHQGGSDSSSSSAEDASSPDEQRTSEARDGAADTSDGSDDDQPRGQLYGHGSGWDSAGEAPAFDSDVDLGTVDDDGAIVLEDSD